MEYAGYLELWPSGHSESLLDLLEKYVDICRRYAASDPQNERAQLEYAEALCRLAYHWLDEYGRHSAEKDPVRALSLSREAVQLVEGLTVGDAEKKNRTLCLAACYLGLGESFEANNKAADAELAYKKALDLRERLLQDEPTDMLLRAAVHAANDTIAHFLRKQGRLVEEEPFFRRAVELMEALVGESPDNPSIRKRLFTLYLDRIAVFKTKGMWREVAAMYQQSLKHLRRAWNCSRISPVARITAIGHLIMQTFFTNWATSMPRRRRFVRHCE
jgi:tetratricopeptide (TPR) repeat protein